MKSYQYYRAGAIKNDWLRRAKYHAPLILGVLLFACLYLFLGQIIMLLWDLSAPLSKLIP